MISGSASPHSSAFMQPYLDKHGSNDPLSDRGSRERDLIAIVGKLVRELHPQRTKSYAIALSSRLEQDLGIDSLARTELILRVEHAFRLRLPIGLVGQVETVADLLEARQASARDDEPALRAAPYAAPMGPGPRRESTPRTSAWRTAARCTESVAP
ncbi:acyl carrier protein [Methylocystis sp. H62]|uniref:acyl carrier protein n=1 Tax=Methylocystis sp. H62 TaxID=2785789 RepID=UPI00289D4E86|nr:acyl carrier protein [Methylocystis sp. H62]